VLFWNCCALVVSCKASATLIQAREGSLARALLSPLPALLASPQLLFRATSALTGLTMTSWEEHTSMGRRWKALNPYKEGGGARGPFSCPCIPPLRCAGRGRPSSVDAGPVLAELRVVANVHKGEGEGAGGEGTAELVARAVACVLLPPAPWHRYVSPVQFFCTVSVIFRTLSMEAVEVAGSCLFTEEEALALRPRLTPLGSARPEWQAGTSSSAARRAI